MLHNFIIYPNIYLSTKKIQNFHRKQRQHSVSPFPLLANSSKRNHRYKNIPWFDLFIFIQTPIIHSLLSSSSLEMLGRRARCCLLTALLLAAAATATCASFFEPFNVTFDHRALILGGKRRMLISAGIHYPRATPQVQFLVVIIKKLIFFSGGKFSSTKYSAELAPNIMFSGSWIERLQSKHWQHRSIYRWSEFWVRRGATTYERSTRFDKFLFYEIHICYLGLVLNS